MKVILSNLQCLLPRSQAFRCLSGVAEINRILQKEPPKFELVPFKKEDMNVIMSEVPDFKYYYIGNSDSKENPYMNVPLTTGIYVKGSEGKYKPVDQDIKFAKLENGLRIACIDRGGIDTMLGLYVNAGSRFETSSEAGVSSMIENMAFHSTAHLSHLRTIKTVETLGGNISCNAFREHMAYHAEGLRSDMPILLNILIGNVLFPRFLPWELKSNKERLDSRRKQIHDSPDSLVTEELHSVAWHNNTLGLHNYCPESSVANYSPDLMREFMLKHFSPDKTVIVGINVDMKELSKWTMRAFAEYNSIPNSVREIETPVYTGGIRYIEGLTPLVHIAVGYEVKSGWNSSDLVVLTVLQSLLGGGGSFSTGGPGKGMHSRLFLNVLNKYEWIENCMAFNTIHSDTGIFGLYMVADPRYSRNVFEIISKELRGIQKISEKEVERAKNTLKSFLHMSIEHKGIVIEDVARQLLFCNRVLTPSELESAIDAVTVDHVKDAARRLITKSQPSVVAYGNINHLPHHGDVLSILSN
ncbi:mitochondrial processing peptidase alpha subunit, putative [Theileria equi strain WA]|uniref:Mitochondrial processing peptidase alpha subunit, putative n=1 Tax=Theileria equi strain WA TaxID=1537102 RepID=L0AVM8_THEEQ|nr:mitochondrial processing peptidase alpha subunit, putative [Theileria equi strain WA]AFZ79081.1 mitochondrial processing peptidase alpha subunit, putative [Theileria equi strain WA]|eukprot:XP_004828747.1 mitochondrial processing peptidase alpha subunit, putative [Theileria equi strain WA]